MKTTTLILAGMIMSITTTSRAQNATIDSQPQPGIFVGQAATAEEAYLRGWAERQRAQGAWMLNGSQAMVNSEEARRRYIENEQARVKGYFAMREKNRRAREAERSHATARASSASQAKKVAPAACVVFNPIKDGQVAWPASLQSECFACGRAQLESLYAQRAAGGELTPIQCEALDQIRKTMLDEIKKHIPEMTCHEYFSALQFVRKLTSVLATGELPERLAGR
jgi:hypothetical protein